jgi:hypothetical protein
VGRPARRYAAEPIDEGRVGVNTVCRIDPSTRIVSAKIRVLYLRMEKYLGVVIGGENPCDYLS